MSAWTPERVAKLKVLWTQGLSCSQIAKELNKLEGIPVSKNAVISKRDRSGLPKRMEPNRPHGPRAKKVVRVKAEPVAPPPPRARAILKDAERSELPPIVFENGRTARVPDLNDSMCKYPYGDPQDADFAFCGRGRSSGPYCADHARLAYVPGSAVAGAKVAA